MFMLCCLFLLRPFDQKQSTQDGVADVRIAKEHSFFQKGPHSQPTAFRAAFVLRKMPCNPFHFGEGYAYTFLLFGSASRDVRGSSAVDTLCMTTAAYSFGKIDETKVRSLGQMLLPNPSFRWYPFNTCVDCALRI